jgi:hypothetical protein
VQDRPAQHGDDVVEERRDARRGVSRPAAVAIVTRRCRSTWSSSSPREGADDRRHTSSGLRRGVFSRPHPGPSPTAPPRSLRSTRGSRGARLGVDVEHGFEPLYVVDPDKKKTVAQLKKQLAGRRRAPARDGRGSRGRGNRLAPARGVEAEGARTADGLPRGSPATRSSRRSGRRATSTSAWWTRRSRGGSSTGSTATRSRPSSGRRSCAGFAAGVQSGCHAPRRRARAASGWRSRAAGVVGHVEIRSIPNRSTRARSRRRAAGGDRVATSVPDGKLAPGRRGHSTRRQARGLADAAPGLLVQRRPRRGGSRYVRRRVRRS